MNNSIRWMLSVALVCALAACGGGGSESAPQSEGRHSVSSASPDELVPPESWLTGVAIDGPLVGAKVCLDLNTNWVCEPNEPSTTTVSGGQYRLNIAPLTVQEVQNKLLQHL